MHKRVEKHHKRGVHHLTIHLILLLFIGLITAALSGAKVPFIVPFIVASMSIGFIYVAYLLTQHKHTIFHHKSLFGYLGAALALVTFSLFVIVGVVTGGQSVLIGVLPGVIAAGGFVFVGLRLITRKNKSCNAA